MCDEGGGKKIELDFEAADCFILVQSAVNIYLDKVVKLNEHLVTWACLCILTLLSDGGANAALHGGVLCRGAACHGSVGMREVMLL